MWNREELAFPGLAVALVSLALFVFIESFRASKCRIGAQMTTRSLGFTGCFLPMHTQRKPSSSHIPTPKQPVRERQQQVKGLCKNTFGPPLFFRGASERGASEREMWQRLRAPHALRSDALTLGN
jgi:hypothetical protein